MSGVTKEPRLHYIGAGGAADPAIINNRKSVRRER
jgi:hypothetical protein